MYKESKILINELKDRALIDKNFILAIDGKSASGKTSVAFQIAEQLSREGIKVNLIHMDDFFLPMELRTAERYEEAGGNVHYERFIEQIAVRLEGDETFEYDRFNCRIMDYDGKGIVNPKYPSIIEGAYALHPNIVKALKRDYDLKVFFDIKENEQLKRIEKRGGRECLKYFVNKWIPLENKYIEAFNIAKECELVLESEEE
ncbi:MAG: hypothetical protein MJ145_00300 [Clostridia bacterium]|nr:hypothetical protein [Clostridia bacterium]